MIQLLVHTQRLYWQHSLNSSSGEAVVTVAHCWDMLVTERCTLTKKCRVLWNLPAEIHAVEAESEDGASNIGHVFVHRSQSQIPNVQ